MAGLHFQMTRRLTLLALAAGLFVASAAAQEGQDAQDTTAGDNPAEDVAEQNNSALIQAYQREFVFLNNEISLLEERLEEVERSGQQRVNRSRERLQQLEAQLLELTGRVDRRSEELRILEEESFDVRDADNALRNIVTQGTSRLREHGVPTVQEAGVVPEDSEITEGDRLALQLGYVFEESFGVLDRLGRFRTEPEEFFLEDGEQVAGEVAYVGDIAAFGVAEDQAAAGTLAPAGGGRLRLVDRSTAEQARALLADPSSVNSLPMYVYESLDNLADTEQEGTFMDTIEAGGVIGFVIVGIGIVAVILVVLRALLLASVGTADRKAVDSAAKALDGKDYDQALAIVSRQKGAAGRVLKSTIEGLKIDPEHIEDVISEAVLNEQPALDRFRAAISVFAAVAPLLGLLGTVTGMIATFDIITQFGTGDPGLLSGGISEALVTTQLGLIVAIPTLLIGNLLSSWSNRITSGLEISALRMVNVNAGYEGSGAA